MRLASWNVNGLRARLEFVKHWLAARQPDVVGLQELKLTEAQFPHAELQAVGYHALVHGQKGWNGVAILSRQPARLIQAGLPGQESMGARLITAEVGGLRFTTIYCPNGKSVDHPDFPLKLAWLAALRNHLRDTAPPGRPALLVGDFNICPTPLDSWNEELLAGRIFHTAEERARFAELLDVGFADAFRTRNPDTVAFSWWDYRGGAFHRRQGLRIDLILATAPVMERIRSVETDREYRKKKEGLIASDHAPVIAELDPAPL